MKKHLVLACLTLAAVAHAAPSACSQIEFAELQTYTDSELKDKMREYHARSMDNAGNTAEFANCTAQFGRVVRIMAARKKAATPS